MATGGGAMAWSSLREVLVEELGIRRSVSGSFRWARNRRGICRGIRRSGGIQWRLRSSSACFTEDQSDERDEMLHADTTT